MDVCRVQKLHGCINYSNPYASQILQHQILHNDSGQFLERCQMDNVLATIPTILYTGSYDSGILSFSSIQQA